MLLSFAAVASGQVEWPQHLRFHLLDAGSGATRWSVPRDGAQAPGAMLAPDVVIIDRGS
jgi:hypothetical protein